MPTINARSGSWPRLGRVALGPAKSALLSNPKDVARVSVFYLAPPGAFGSAKYLHFIDSCDKFNHSRLKLNGQVLSIELAIHPGDARFIFLDPFYADFANEFRRDQTSVIQDFPVALSASAHCRRFSAALIEMIFLRGRIS